MRGTTHRTTDNVQRMNRLPSIPPKCVVGGVVDCATGVDRQDATDRTDVTAAAKPQSAAIDGRATGVGVVGIKRQRARAIFDQGPTTTDHATKGLRHTGRIVGKCKAAACGDTDGAGVDIACIAAGHRAISANDQMPIGHVGWATESVGAVKHQCAGTTGGQARCAGVGTRGLNQTTIDRQ